MKIVVCLKQIFHTYARTGMDIKKHYLAPEDQITRINPYDEAALELALKLKDKNPAVEITLLTLGPVLAEDELRRCLALGADHLYQVDDEAYLEPRAKAQILARVIQSMDPELVLCGKESMDQQNGQVAGFLADYLNRPFVSAIESLDMVHDKTRVRVKRGCGRGVRQVIESLLPAVFSVDMGAFEYRMPKSRFKEEAETKPVQVIKEVSEDGPESDLVSVSVAPPCPRTKPIPVPHSDLASFDRIKQLLTGSRMKKKARILDGSPESQVAGLVTFLDENGFINNHG